MIRELLGLKPKENLGKHRTYRIWKAMRERCRSPNHQAFSRYGGRAIKVCDRWSKFPNFLEDMGHPPSDLHSIDRFPNKNGNYEPGNCRWATAQQQSDNKTSTIFVAIPSGMVTLKEAARYHGVKYTTAHRRMMRGWPESRWFEKVSSK